MIRTLLKGRLLRKSESQVDGLPLRHRKFVLLLMQEQWTLVSLVLVLTPYSKKQPDFRISGLRKREGKIGWWIPGIRGER